MPSKIKRDFTSCSLKSFLDNTSWAQLTFFSRVVTFRWRNEFYMKFHFRETENKIPPQWQTPLSCSPHSPALPSAKKSHFCKVYNLAGIEIYFEPTLLRSSFSSAFWRAFAIRSAWAFLDSAWKCSLCTVWYCLSFSITVFHFYSLIFFALSNVVFKPER